MRPVMRQHTRHSTNKKLVGRHKDQDSIRRQMFQGCRVVRASFFFFLLLRTAHKVLVLIDEKFAKNGSKIGIFVSNFAAMRKIHDTPKTLLYRTRHA